MNNQPNLPVPSEAAEALNLIRVETALSRYPIHRLSNKGTIRINIRKQDDRGAAVLRWDVDYSNHHGQPGPLAYKLDTLVINRKIDEGDRPVPKLIKLGSLHDIAQELDLGRNTLAVRKALLQNVGAMINARITYRAVDRSERSLEATFNRYSVIFTGEVLPDGRKADAVYLLLNDIYLDVLNNAVRRPMDYDYLRELPPGPQRFYEILSYEMLPAIKFDQRAKLPYSEFCLYSTMTRYTEYEQVKKQMYKIHRPHIERGYIEPRVEFESARDGDGKPDWNMLYVPGGLARRQHLAFCLGIRSNAARKQIPVQNSADPQTRPQHKAHVSAHESARSAGAGDLVRTFYRLRYGHEQEATDKEMAEASAYLTEGQAWAAHLVGYAASEGREKDGFPNEFGGVKKLIGSAREAFEEASKVRHAQETREARAHHRDAHTAAYQAFLGRLLGNGLQATLPHAYAAFIAQEKSTYAYHKSRAEKSSLSARMIDGYYSEVNRVKRLLKYIEDNPDCGVPDFWQWDETINPEPFNASSSSTKG